jgi:asparagine synthase (glutamine-hydrolysing)
MCGIAGIFGDKARDRRLVSAMRDTLAHRGPDDQADWIDAEAGIALAHRRLAVVDLSPAGRQPMESADGRFVLTFNGEIYNFPEVRNTLEREGHVPQSGWRGHSDTEVFLQAIATWGLYRALGLSAGMFAFALWDKRERLLTLVRDRFGEKPLYYGWAGTDFLFGSELKALREHPQFDHSIDRGALSLFASRAQVPAPLSIYKGVYKLPPGCLLQVTSDGARTRLDAPPVEGARGNGLQLKRYWSYRGLVERGLTEPIDDEGEALAAVEKALVQSIRGQSFADVPVGAFLSGGIDSSAVTALYQRHSPIPVRTFSIGFDEAAYNEAEDAKAVARHLGTIHHEHYVTAMEARDAIPLLPSMYDEPFADSSQIPTYLVSRFARGQVTVALTGDGADELFGGYYRHFMAPRVWRDIQRVPKAIRAVAGWPLSRISWRFWNRAAGVIAGRHQPHIGIKIQNALRVATSNGSFDEVYRSLLDQWSAGASPLARPGAADLPFQLEVEGAPDTIRGMYCDAVSYLPDDILCKVDRASMAVSLETRLPFLDHRVAEVAARVPLSMKVQNGRGKVILRKLLHQYVPAELVERPKTGFAVPVGEWIKGPLRPWAEELLDARTIRQDGWFNVEVLSARWRDHLSGTRDSTDALWSILMFQAWLREQTAARAAAA